MGTAKAAMEWHGSTLLYRTAALLGRTLTGPVVVVSAAGQELPPLPRGVRVVADPLPGLGPLQGIAAGLAAVTEAGAAFVCSTDLPFLHPAFVRRVVTALHAPALHVPALHVPALHVTALDEQDADVALPYARGYRQPLAACYRTALAEQITALLAAGRRRPGMLFERCRVRELDDATLLADPAVALLDPDLESVTNVNEPAEYAAARARLPEPVVVVCSGHRHSVRGATLGEAAAAVGALLTDGVEVTLNGGRVDRDLHLPLVAGDVVAFDEY